MPKEISKRIVVLCHGRSVDKDEYGIFIKLSDVLTKNWHHVYRFDFRGSGQSDGEDIDMTLSSEKEDILEVCSYLKGKWYTEIVLLWASFAGGPTLLAQEKLWDEVIAVILRNGLIDYRYRRKSRDKNHYKELEEKWFRYRSDRKFRCGKVCYDEVEKTDPYLLLANKKRPICMIHGTKDEKIPYEGIVELSKEYRVPLYTIIWAEHGFHSVDWSKNACEAVINFLKEIDQSTSE